MQSVSSRIWTRVDVFISYDDNNYTTGTSILVKGDPKAPFSIATTPRCRGGRYSFPIQIILYNVLWVHWVLVATAVHNDIDTSVWEGVKDSCENFMLALLHQEFTKKKKKNTVKTDLWKLLVIYKVRLKISLFAR